MRCCARRCPPVQDDRYLAPDIEHSALLVIRGPCRAVFRSLPGLPALWVAA